MNCLFLQKWNVYPKLFIVGLLLMLAVSFAGCNSSNESSTDDDENSSVKVVKHDVNVLMIGDAELKEAIERQWQSAGHQIQLTVTGQLDADPDKLKKQLDGIDAVIYSPDRLGMLVSQGLLQAVDYSKLDRKLLAESDLLKLQRRDLVQYGGEVWAASIGSPVLSLVYRQDVMEALGEKPPTNWTEYERISKKLADVKGTLKDREGKVLPTAVLEPMKGDWKGHMMMARVSSAICRRGQRANQMSLSEAIPLIDQAPFRRSLNNMKESIAGHGTNSLTPPEVFSEMVKGNAAMAITWPTASVDFEETSASLALSPLPVWRNRYDLMEKNWTVRAHDDPPSALIGFDGKVVSIVASARNLDSARYFLAWICSADIQQKIWTRSPSCSLSRTSQVRKPYVWCGRNLPRQVADEYASWVQQMNQDGLPMFVLRIPKSDQYQASLNRAVDEVLNGEADADVALKKAVGEWNEITDQVGRAQQALEYRKSLGLNN